MKFKYRKKTASVVMRRANDTGSVFDHYLRPDVNSFSPKEGENIIRILPDTWDSEEDSYFGYDMWLHYRIGADESSYLCLKKMKGKPCPVCEEWTRAKNEGDEEYASQLRPVKRVGVWLIDRNSENEGPKLWAMPKTVEKDLAIRMVDRRTGKILPIDHPEIGYDISFIKEGSGRSTRYVGLEISRTESPISDDDAVLENWLTYIVENPIPDVLVFYSYDHIKSVLSGSHPTREEHEDNIVDSKENVDRKTVKKAKKRMVMIEEDEDNEDNEEEIGEYVEEDEDEDVVETSSARKKLEALKRRISS